jgi:hypothetical protein
MTRTTPDDVRVLHAVRVLGYAGTARLAQRVALTVDQVDEHLLDAQARGWVAFSSYAGDEGWSLTESGRSHGERLLAAELEAAGARATVDEVHRQFLPHNDVVAAACTRWQLTELGVGGHAVTQEKTIAALEGPAQALGRLEGRLTAALPRFSGYHHRFTKALASARSEPAWITGTDRDSCHRVWFELHEDLIATLGLTR